MGCTISDVTFQGKPSALYPELQKLYKDDDLAYQKYNAAISHLADYDAAYLRPSGEPTLYGVQMMEGSPSAIQVNAKRLTAIQQISKNVEGRLQKRLDAYRERQGAQVGFSPKEKTVSELASLLEDIAMHGEQDKFVDLLLYAEHDLRTITQFLKNSFSVTGQHHADALTQIQAQLSTYEDIVQPDLALGNTALREAITSANKEYAEAKALVEQRTQEYAIHLILDKANSEGLTPEQVATYVRKGEDINLASMALGDTSSSTMKLLAATDKALKLKKQQIMDKHDAFREKVRAVGQKLFSAQGSKDFSWMLKTKDGKATGKYVQKVGESYDVARAAAEKDLFNSDGSRKEYFRGSLTPEQKKHNIALAVAKKKSRSFLQAEVEGKNGMEDSAHHKYSQAFKLAREYYQSYEYIQGEGKQWVKKDGVDEEEYQRFLRQYYNDEVAYWSPVKDRGTGDYTGEVVQKRGRFPKNEHVEIIGFEDPQYKKIMADNSSLGKARKDFYEFFVNSYQDEALNKLPKSVRQGMVGTLPIIRANKLSSLNSKGTGFLDAAGNMLKNPGKTLKNAVVPEVYTKGRRTTEEGYLDHDLPIYYVGGVQSNERIAALEKDLTKATPEEKATIERKLLIERNRMKGSEIELDLVESITAFSEMAEDYEGLKELESTMDLAKHAIEQRDYYQTDNSGNLVMDKDGNPIVKDKGTSRTEKRFKAWLTQNYYGDDDSNTSQLDAAIKKVLAYTSVTFQALNPFSAVNNFVTANINQHIEAKGGQFYNADQYSSANKEFLRDVSKNISQHVSSLYGNKGYEPQPQNSKVDAMLKHFRALQAGSDYQNNKTRSIADYAYVGIEAGEYQAQGTSAIAMLLATRITGKDGTVSNLYDVFQLEKGKLTVNPNFEVPDTLRHEVTNKIRNANKYIHGNYSQEDKVLLQQHWLGNLALQFKKWVFNGARARWGSKYYDEGIGLEMEGRYRAVARMFQAMKLFGGAGVDINKMTPLEQANLRKSATEAAYFAGALAIYLLVDAVKAGIPDDDDNLLAAVNFIQRQASRTAGEVSTYVSPMQVYGQLKNPIAALTLVKDTGLFIERLTSVPFYLATGNSEKLSYASGVNKGDSKLLKSTRDLFPVLRNARQIEQLYSTGEFFIR